MIASPLYSLYRSNVQEVCVFGWIAVHDGEKVVFQSGEALPEVPFRSLLKPIQFLATGMPCEERFAGAPGSVSATPAQLSQLKTWFGSSPQLPFLKLPPSYPLEERYRAVMQEERIPKDHFYNNCFSKHVAILEACDREHWDKRSYLDKNHPYHRRLNATICGLLGMEVMEIPTVVDGCQLPSPVMGLEKMAHLYQRLADPRTNARLQQVQDFMLRWPEWIGGPGRMDTLLMKANEGRVIAKEGADGLLGIAVLPQASCPNGLGIAIKLASGYAPQAAVLALGPILSRYGLKTVVETPVGQTISHHYEKERQVWDISPILDETLAVWPGDVPFKRKVSADTLQGQHLTLSSIETSVHIGAHTDAPNHFEASRRGISEVDVRKYLGPCQVITVRRPPGTRIEWEHVKHLDLRAPRLLCRTESFPDPRKFNEDFVALSESLIREAAQRGILLVGIDTPSIDLFDSKDLPAHHATLKSGVAVLEGIILKGVEDGVYNLIAAPLKLRETDASPVRAVLTR